ncbi:MAG: antibiotic biosynthesis monooxygenase [Ignavibacteria bacterium]|nr:antibiotic biosynthesis monooxygenase [Ignavibacteria bacterium]
MHMRMVHIKIKTGQIQTIEALYRDRIIPALGSVQGCRFAGLLQSAHHPEDCISMTMWDSDQDATNYQGSGLYASLLEEARPFLADATDTTVRLSEDLTLEYVEVPEEPVIHSHPVAATTDTTVESIEGRDDIWVRIVLLKIRPGKHEEFKRRYVEHVIPTLRQVRGCRHAYLTGQDDDPDILASVTTWDSRQDAETYEQSGLYDQLIDSQKEFLSSLYEWKRHREGRGRPGVATSEDVVVELYNILESKTFGTK